MQTQLQKPDHIVSLATSSVLVSVDIKVWTATKQDREISNEITSAKHADSNAGRFVKHLLANDVDHKKVLNYRQTVYNWLQRKTYEWSGSQQCLPHISLPTFMREFEVHKTEFYALVDAFCTKYPTIVSNMAFAQGDMFCRDDYPTVDRIRDKFSIEIYTSEIPLGDFRCQVSQELADDLFKNYSKQTERIIKEILNKQAEQFVNVMSSISHCCGEDETTDKNGEIKIKKRKIYDTTLSRAMEMCETFKSFNLTNNAALEDARRDLEKALSGVSIDMLRESTSKREQVKSDIDDILAKFRPQVAAQ
jgi:hypothetical protein